MSKNNNAWVQQMEDLATAANVGHVDIVVDQMGSTTRVLPAMKVMHPPMPWFSLFSGTPEEPLVDQAPILMRISLDNWRHKAWLEELVRHFAAEPRLLVLVSPMPFEALAKALQALSQLEWGGQTGLLRFYDPRVLPWLLTDVLQEQQRARFLGVALFIGWLDRDQLPEWRPGAYQTGQPVPDRQAPIVLDDAQFDRLGSVSDAQALVPTVAARLPELSAEDCFARCYQLVLQASASNYFGDLKAYAALQLDKPAVQPEPPAPSWPGFF